ncbi:flippase [bacterium]|nr:flippase [bacterium]
MKILPGPLRRRFEHRSNFLKIVDNIGWLFFDRVLRMGVGLIVGVWIARFLGPEQFGVLSFATSFVGLFGAISGLGLQGIVVRDLVRGPEAKEDILGTAVTLQLIGGVVAYCCILLAIAWLRPDDSLSRVIVAVLGSMMLFRVSDVAIYWFESQVLSKYTVWVQSSCFLFFAVIKVGLIVINAPLMAFAWATTAEALIVAVLLGVIFSLRGPGLQRLRFTLVRAKAMLTDSWPLLFSGIALTVNMGIDQIMLGQIAGDEAVGIYSVAVRVSEVWYFAIAMFLASVFPYLAKQNELKTEDLPRRWIQAYRFMFWLSLMVAVVLSVLAEPLVDLLFGAEYSGAAAILSLHVWAGVNVAVGSVWSKWLLLENELQYGLYAQLAGAILNVGFNLVLIREYGAMGAAIATLASYWLSALFAYSLHKPATTFTYLFEAITGREFR